MKDEFIDVGDWKKRLNLFAAEREWEKFHNPKNLAMALSVEASELMEIFQWLSVPESEELKDNQELKIKASDEMADVLVYLIRLATVLDVDLNEAVETKMLKNAKKYPADRVKGSAKKYYEYKEK